jgi:UDP-glucose 4-epimerase
MPVVHLAWLIQPGRDEALLELIAGMRAGAEFHAPPLARETGGPVRLREFLTGLGARP